MKYGIDGLWYNLLIEVCGSSLHQLDFLSLKLFRYSSSSREEYSNLCLMRRKTVWSLSSYNALSWSRVLTEMESLKSVSFFFRNHTILKASSTCCGQGDSSQHRVILGSGKASETARTSGAVVQVLNWRRRPQNAHLRYHLYVGAMLNCLTFCFDFLMRWNGLYCL